jgi:hypothetical protein
MSLQAFFGAIGLWVGIQAIRMSWVPRLTRIATVAALVSGFFFVQALTGFLLLLARIGT